MNLRSYQELSQIPLNDRSDLKEKIEQKKVEDVQECKAQLRELWHPAEENTDQINTKIETCVDILIKMNTLIVVFDAIKCSDNLEDMIADVQWNEISYQRKKGTESDNNYNARAEELKWCMVKFFFVAQMN